MSEQANIALIQTGARIQHKKGGIYRVIARCDGGTVGLSDMAEMIFVVQEGIHRTYVYLDYLPRHDFLKPTVLMPVTVQLSNPLPRSCLWIIYQNVTDNRCWARPADEFQDRFTEYTDVE